MPPAAAGNNPRGGQPRRRAEANVDQQVFERHHQADKERTNEHGPETGHAVEGVIHKGGIGQKTVLPDPLHTRQVHADHLQIERDRLCPL